MRTIPRQWEWGLLEVDFGPEPAPGHDEDIDGVQHRDPIPVPQLVEAVQLRLAEDMAWEQIEERVGLSHRKVNYIRQAIKAGDLSWAPNRAVPVFGPDTRNSAGGVTLPKR